MITQDEAIALAQEVGANYWNHGMNADQLTALCNAVRKQTLLEAAEWFDDGYEYSAANNIARDLRRMAGEE